MQKSGAPVGILILLVAVAGMFVYVYQQRRARNAVPRMEKPVHEDATNAPRRL